jgi:hypothetical protein
MSGNLRFTSARFGLVLGLVIAWCVMSSEASMASAVVMDSSIKSLQRGQELADDQKLDIPSGDHVLVGVIQNGQVKQVDIKGPRTGTVKELLNPEPTSTRVWGVILQLLRTGGASEGDVAASRGVRLTLNDMPIHGNVSVCLEEGSAPTIALASGSDSTTVRLSDNQGAPPATLTVPAGTSGVAWPSSIPIKDGDVYRIMEASNPQIELKVHVVPHGTLTDSSSLHALEVLVTHGCEQQAMATLRKKMSRQ